MKFDESKEVVEVVGMSELKVLGKAVMDSAVEAELLGLDAVTQYLSLAFDEVARVAAEVRARAEAEVAKRLLVGGENGAGGS